MDDTVLFAFALTSFAGLSTGFGSILALFVKQTNTRFLSMALGFSAGVMIYVSFVELLVTAKESLSRHWGEASGSWVTVCSFFGGMLLIGLIDRMVPAGDNPHELHNTAGLVPATTPEGADLRGEIVTGTDRADTSRLHRTGVMTALAIGIHNFPEGLATFAATLSDLHLGAAIAVAVAIHNIPEGIAVAVPIYFATGSKKRAFGYSFLSGLAEPVGAFLGYLILMPFFTPAVMGILLGLVAGIMVFISFDELLPTAEEYGEHHLCLYGMIVGMAVMAFSLLLLQ